MTSTQGNQQSGMGGAGQGGDNKDEKDKKVRRWNSRTANGYCADVLNRRRSPSTNHLHDQQRESDVRSARPLVQMHLPSFLPSTLRLDAS